MARHRSRSERFAIRCGAAAAGRGRCDPQTRVTFELEICEATESGPLAPGRSHFDPIASRVYSGKFSNAVFSDVCRASVANQYPL